MTGDGNSNGWEFDGLYLWEEGEIEDAEELIKYYKNNRKGLMPYQPQVKELPEHPEGLEYRNMGTMENHVWSVIARRMKHDHTSWSRRGGTIFLRYWQRNAVESCMK